jgi:hypothetical protein
VTTKKIRRAFGMMLQVKKLDLEQLQRAFAG